MLFRRACRANTGRRTKISQMTRQVLITQFVHYQRSETSVVPEDRTIALSFFDASGLALVPWARRGYTCVAYIHSEQPSEWSDSGFGSIRRVVAPLTPEALKEIACQYDEKVAFACAAPPGTDLSVAGARYWAEKRLNNPHFQKDAVAFIRAIHTMFEDWQCPYYISHPATSLLRKLWRSPDYVYSPNEYGGLLSPTDPHPLYPKIIPLRDAHVQHTGLWCGGRFRLPLPSPVEPVWKTSKRNKKGKIRKISPVLASRAGRAARSCTPRGFALALCHRLHGE